MWFLLKIYLIFSVVCYVHMVCYIKAFISTGETTMSCRKSCDANVIRSIISIASLNGCAHTFTHIKLLLFPRQHPHTRTYSHTAIHPHSICPLNVAQHASHIAQHIRKHTAEQFHTVSYTRSRKLTTLIEQSSAAHFPSHSALRFSAFSDAILAARAEFQSTPAS